MSSFQSLFFFTFSFFIKVGEFNLVQEATLVVDDELQEAITLTTKSFVATA